MQVWNVLHNAHWKHRTQKIAKNSQSAHHCTALSGYIVANKACIDNRTKKVKQQYLLHMCAQYGELQPTKGWDRITSLGYPSKFQRVSCLAFVTAATSLIAGQPNVRCYIYIHFRGLLPPDGILPSAKFTLRPSLAILAALLHGTPAVVVSQTLRRGTRNSITDFRREHHIYSAGRPSHWALAHTQLMLLHYLVKLKKPKM